MSGGSMNYIYYQISEAADMTDDKEISEILKDLSKLLHDEEWYHSSDYGKEDYLKSLTWFKQKWFNSDRHERLKQYVDEEMSNMKERIYSIIGVTDN